MLESVIADRRCSPQSLLEVPGFNEIAVTLGMMSPYPGETVGLQLHPNGEGVSLSAGCLMLKAIHPFGDAEKILDVMPDLVGDDIGLREVTRRAEPASQFVEE